MSNCIIKGNEALLMQYDQLALELDSEILGLKLPKPALRALINLNIKTLDDIRKVGIEAVASAHGMGPKSIQLIRELLK